MTTTATNQAETVDLGETILPAGCYNSGEKLRNLSDQQLNDLCDDRAVAKHPGFVETLADYRKERGLPKSSAEKSKQDDRPKVKPKADVQNSVASPASSKSEPATS